MATPVWNNDARVNLILDHGIKEWCYDTESKLWASRGKGHPIEQIDWMERGTLLAWLS